jgi:hypothetical protein
MVLTEKQNGRMIMRKLNNEIHELNIDELDFVSGGDSRLLPVLKVVALTFGHRVTPLPAPTETDSLSDMGGR